MPTAYDMTLTILHLRYMALLRYLKVLKVLMNRAVSWTLNFGLHALSFERSKVSRRQAVAQVSASAFRRLSRRSVDYLVDRKPLIHDLCAAYPMLVVVCLSV